MLELIDLNQRSGWHMLEITSQRVAAPTLQHGGVPGQVGVDHLQRIASLVEQSTLDLFWAAFVDNRKMASFTQPAHGLPRENDPILSGCSCELALASAYRQPTLP